jgi:hypothetical protein
VPYNSAMLVTCLLLNQLCPDNVPFAHELKQLTLRLFLSTRRATAVQKEQNSGRPTLVSIAWHMRTPWRKPSTSAPQSYSPQHGSKSFSKLATLGRIL